MRSEASTSYSVPVGGKLHYTGAWTWPKTGSGYAYWAAVIRGWLQTFGGIRKS